MTLPNRVKAFIEFRGRDTLDLFDLWRRTGGTRSLKIGREDGTSTADVVLRGEMTSRNHAELRYFENEGWKLRDAQSVNGTSINEKRLEPKQWRLLRDKDVICFAHDSVQVAKNQVDIAVVRVSSASGLPRSAASARARRASTAPPPAPSVGSPSVPAVEPEDTAQRRKRPAAELDEPPASRGQRGPASALRSPAGPPSDPEVGPTARGPVPIGPMPPPASKWRGSTSSQAQIGPQLPPEQARGFGPQLPSGSSASSSSAPRYSNRRASVNGSGGGAKGEAATNGASRGVKRPLEAAPAADGKSAKCDKCDGPHLTDACPHYKKARENHKDAWLNYGRKHPLSMGKDGGKVALGGRVVPQPGDGSCLFHSLCYGLSGLRMNGVRGGIGAQQLRRQIAEFIQKHPKLEIAGDTLEDWIKWDSQSTVSQYTQRMAYRGWGGGIEMAAFSILNAVNVHVYEARRRGLFERISCFDCPQPTKKTVHVLYKGGMHFDALVVN